MGGIEKICDVMNVLKPTILMVLVQIAWAVVTTLYKLCANDGMSLRVMIAYRFIFGFVASAPLALLLERNSRPKLTRMVLLQAFVCALFGGSLAQNLFVEGIAMTNATFATAMANIVPALTFIMAIFFGLEKLGLKTIRGQAKVMGTLICISGAMLLTFYKGAELKLWSKSIDLLHHNNHQSVRGVSHQGAINHILGPLYSVLSTISVAFSLIIQAKFSKLYPCHYSSSALISLMGMLQSVVFALCIERDWNQWKLGWNVRLLTVAYSGIVGSGLVITIIMWVVRKRGPLFVSVFNPLLLVVVAIGGSIFLNENLHVGSVVGAVVIIVGLYAVLWGKGKEMKRDSQITPSNAEQDSYTDDKTIPHPNMISVAPNFFPNFENGDEIYPEDEEKLEEGIHDIK